jgi:hypothetical protein
MALISDDIEVIRAHYEQHLGPLYTWMIGGLAAATEAAREELRVALFEELHTLAPPHLRITFVEDDLRHVRHHAVTPVDVITCMGETLTHRPVRTTRRC